jgi:lysyl-tRNA synthetase class 2
VLAETRRSFPDKWHGITDPDTRYRQRYVDLWVTEEARRTLVLRSRGVSLIRRFFEDRATSRSRPRCCTPSPAARWPNRS